MTNLMAASAQWASRPQDQRFVDLESLQMHVDARRMASRSKVMPLSALAVSHDDTELYVHGHNGQGSKLTNWSFGQMATLVKAPASYLRSLPSAVAEINLEYGMRFSDAARSDSQIYYTDDGQVSEIRAATGPKYGRIFDAQIVRAVRQMNEGTGNRWTVPTPFKKADGSHLGQEGFTVDKNSTTLYASDRDIWMFLVDESRPISIGDQTYFRGFYTWNSEVGKATFGLATFLYSYVCCNRIIWDATEVEELRIRHTHLAPERFIQEATPALAALSEASTKPIEDAIRKAQETKIANKPSEVEAWLERKGFGRLESGVAVSLAARGGDTGSNGDPTNLWDLIQGGTAAARAIGHTDDRVDAEKRFSGLLRYAGQDIE